MRYEKILDRLHSARNAAVEQGLEYVTIRETAAEHSVPIAVVHHCETVALVKESR